jgi:hypothetical protein
MHGQSSSISQSADTSHTIHAYRQLQALKEKWVEERKCGNFNRQDISAVYGPLYPDLGVNSRGVKKDIMHILCTVADEAHGNQWDKFTYFPWKLARPFFVDHAGRIVVKLDTGDLAVDFIISKWICTDTSSSRHVYDKCLTPYAIRIYW